MAIIASLSKSTLSIFYIYFADSFIYKFTGYTIFTFLSICIFCTYFVNLSLLVLYPSLNLNSASAVNLFVVFLNCIKSCSFRNFLVLLTITASSLLSSFLANVSSNVSFSFSISLTFFINILLISFDILLPHSNFGFSHCILIILLSVDLVLYLSYWKLLLIFCFLAASSLILVIFSSFFPSVG